MSNNRLAYAIAESHGLDTKGKTPKEVWEMLSERGVSVTYPQNTPYEKMIDEYEKGTETDEKEIKDDKGRKPIILPKQEYAELCSAIRTKYGNKIPKSGDMLYNDYYHVYNYNKNKELILFREKIEIENNQERITILERNNVK